MWQYLVLFLFSYAFRFVIEHCDVLIDDRNECGYPGISKVECEDRHCCWIPFSQDDLRNPPWCTSPASNICGYTMQSSNTLQDRCNSSRKLNFTAENIDEDILRIKITRSSGDFRVPEWIYPEISKDRYKNESLLRLETFSDKYENFNFKIIRSNDTIWDTDLNDSKSSSSIQMKLMYTQVGSRLPVGHAIYGLGYHAGKLKIESGTRLALYARDSPTIENQNLYGAHPFYIEIRNGTAHGVYLRNSFGMDVIVNDESIKFKALGGPIDLFFFAGPTPSNVIEQYTRIIGRPAMFDYRVLGFHQSRYGYRNISQISKVVDEYREAGIPLDTIWFDIDYMDKKKDFTLDETNFPPEEVKKFAKKLLKSHQRIIPILDPGIKIESNYGPYVRGVKEQIFIRNPNDAGFYVGEVWPGSVHFVDFFNEDSVDYWQFELESFFNFSFTNATEVIGGLWLDMNEPSNFIDGYNYSFYDMPADYGSFSLNFPRYTINNGGNEAPIYRKTVPMDAMTDLGPSYHTHNLYGLFESFVTYVALQQSNPSRRPFLLTRSTFPGSGRWTATWLGDNLSTFPQMTLSISGVLQYGLMGLPMSGPDICGFMGNATEELCARWMALGSFYPFARNHNSIDATVDQEPFRSETVANVSRKYLRLRYSLLPFFYTLMHLSHVKGSPIWSPIFFYDNSSDALDISDQFFIGKELLLSPVLIESSEAMNVLIPAGEWYEWETFNFIKSSIRPLRVLYETPIDFLPIHLRAGSIFVLQDPKMTMFETRSTNFTLLIALDSDGKASGELYWDDGESVDVKDQFVDIRLHAIFDHSRIFKLSYIGVFGLFECLFVEKMIILTSGKHVGIVNVNNSSDYYLIMKHYGFDIIFMKPRRLNESFSVSF